MCRLSWNLEASKFWNPQGLSRPVMELKKEFKRSEGDVQKRWSWSTHNYVFLDPKLLSDPENKLPQLLKPTTTHTEVFSSKVFVSFVRFNKKRNAATHFLKTPPHIKSHKNPFAGGRLVPRGRMNSRTHTDESESARLTFAFGNCVANAPYN
jgi:hypothetical protein